MEEDDPSPRGTSQGGASSEHDDLKLQVIYHLPPIVAGCSHLGDCPTGARCGHEQIRLLSSCHQLRFDSAHHVSCSHKQAHVLRKRSEISHRSGIRPVPLHRLGWDWVVEERMLCSVKIKQHGMED